MIVKKAFAIYVLFLASFDCFLFFHNSIPAAGVSCIFDFFMAEWCCAAAAASRCYSYTAILAVAVSILAAVIVINWYQLFCCCFCLKLLFLLLPLLHIY